jgi:hypothetical protein
MLAKRMWITIALALLGATTGCRSWCEHHYPCPQTCAAPCQCVPPCAPGTVAASPAVPVAAAAPAQDWSRPGTPVNMNCTCRPGP